MSTLDALQPLLPPPPVPWWPPAPGWWLLAVGVPLLLCALWYLSIRLHRRPAHEPELDSRRQRALDELASLAKPYYQQPAGPWLQQLNGLLKRLCLQHYPDSHCQTLSGRAWLAFLDNRCPAAGLTRWMVLVDGAYRPQCLLDDKAVDDLHRAVETWIRKHV
jgi:hypothetical protein